MKHILISWSRRTGVTIFALAILLIAVAGCGGAGPDASTASDADPETGALTLPAVAELATEGEPLRVLATTSIIGDVVRQVGGDAIDLVVLMPPGQDPHSYQPGASDLTAAADADVIFINGWDLEEGLVDDLATIGREAAIVPVSAGISPRVLGEEEHEDEEHESEEHAHGPVDPHVWQDVTNVMQWAENIRRVLGAADPANAAVYDANAARYLSELEKLDADLRASLAAIPSEKRIFITNHDNLGYFADAYEFEVVGTIIPSVSTLAEPTAGAMASLVKTMEEHGICTLVTETTAGRQLARTLQNELSSCESVELITLTTDALGPSGSGADTYIGMMRANAAALAGGLR